MDWQDEGAVLNVRKHGETSAIVEVLTAEHGRHGGVVRGASSRKIAPNLQPGTQVSITWRARLEEHLGSFTIEPLKSRAAATMGGRLELAGLNAVTALVAFSLPEREAHPKLYEQTISVLDMIGETELWPLAYLHWELSLLDETGFGLDLTKCAVSGSDENLIYVSPKTGRAVSAGSAGEWKDRLLPLPNCLKHIDANEVSEISEGLRTTGHFLTTQLAPSLGEKQLPPARQRFVDLLIRQGLA